MVFNDIEFSPLGNIHLHAGDMELAIQKLTSYFGTSGHFDRAVSVYSRENWNETPGVFFDQNKALRVSG